MAHRQAIVRQVVALLAGIVASCSCALAATDWGVRPIVADAEGVIYNADVMVSPAGEIAVGYAISPGYPSGGTVTLARLRGRIFEYRDFSLDGITRKPRLRHRSPRTAVRARETSGTWPSGLRAPPGTDDTCPRSPP